MQILEARPRDKHPLLAGVCDTDMVIVGVLTYADGLWVLAMEPIASLAALEKHLSLVLVPGKQLTCPTKQKNGELGKKTFYSMK